MSESLEWAYRLVKEINIVYNTLSTLTDDDLRARIKSIRKGIRESENISKSLDEFIVEVYAIVKETARRLAIGNLRVKADEYDNWLAKHYDFIQIEGDYAIYLNKWDTDGSSMKWNMIHYDEQILGGILLHYGYAVEMATGEGKTLVATLPVFLNALPGLGVHLATVNDYLSKRDFQITRPIYMFHGLTADCIERYDYHAENEKRKDAYACDITFGTNSGFIFDYLRDHMSTDPEECVQRSPNFAVIDELDSILLDEAATPHIIAGGAAFSEAELYTTYQPIIKELVEGNEKNEFIKYSVLGKYAHFTEKGKHYLCDKLCIPDLFKYKRLYEIEGKDIDIDEKEKILRNLKIKNALEKLLFAYTVSIKDVDYIVKDDRIVIIDQNTGRLRVRSRWEHGLHTAIEVKEGVTVRHEHIGYATISIKNYYKLYSKIAGMSGTIMSEMEELKQLYGLKSATLPTHLPIRRIDQPLRIYRNEKEKDLAIIDAVKSNFYKGRPTLLGTSSLKRADRIQEFLEAEGLPFNRLDARSVKTESETVAKAGIGNTITLSTSIAGRGTDIKPSKDVIERGGLSVIATDLLASSRSDRQLKGRTGRQGNPGNSVTFVSLEDQILEYLDVKDKENLSKELKGIDSKEISFDNIRKYFHKAQNLREKQQEKKRKSTARKDDIISPHRARFYKQRNEVLHSALNTMSIVKNLSQEFNLPFTNVEEQIYSLYEKVKEYVIKTTWNNQNRKYIPVPFVENLHPFAIELNIKETILNKKYFFLEFIRQNILQLYDKFWKDFVSYILEDLDEKEIGKLEERYNAMMREIGSIIIIRLTKSYIVYSEKSLRDSVNAEMSGERVGIYHKKIGVGDTELCPCGSGKKYCDCHGSGSHNKKVRRRR